MKIKSFDVARMIVEEADKRFSPGFRIVPMHLDILKNYCEAIDEIMDGQFSIGFEFSINEDTMDTELKMILDDFTIKDTMHGKFRQLVERAGTLTFENIDGESMSVKLSYPPLWEKV